MICSKQSNPRSEIPLVFHLDIALWGLGEVELSKQWVRYWTQVRLRVPCQTSRISPLKASRLSLQFAKTGNPNGAGTNGADPTWSPFGSATQDSVAIFNITEAGAVNISMASGIRSAFCSFWANNIVPEVSLRRVYVPASSSSGGTHAFLSLQWLIF